ncbi:hypothetical protein FU659_24970 [Paenibacillus sp. N3.4]|nr:hypothetical protein FU659_24970 [Paenibacillus sp. N3.4]
MTAGSGWGVVVPSACAVPTPNGAYKTDDSNVILRRSALTFLDKDLVMVSSLDAFVVVRNLM